MTEADSKSSGALMEVADVVAYTRLSESNIRKQAAAGAIPVVRIGRRTLFRREDVDRWLDSKTEGRAA